MITIFTRSDLKRNAETGGAGASSYQLAGQKKRKAAEASALSLFVEDGTVTILDDSPINPSEICDMLWSMTAGAVDEDVTIGNCFELVLEQLREMESDDAPYRRRDFIDLLADALDDSDKVRAALVSTLKDIRRKGEMD